VIASNNMPKLRTVDDALSRRFTAVPFNRKFDTYNDAVPRYLAAEAPAFLGHLIQEAVALAKRVDAGLPAAQVLHLPRAVVNASRQQIEMQDVLGEWMAMRLVDAPEVQTPFRLLYEDFQRCRLDRHDKDWSERVFSQELAKRGRPSTRLNHHRMTMVEGVAFRPDAWDSPVADALAGFEAADAAARSNVITLRKPPPGRSDGTL
jgi:phage/plasmid-associated DNA primase